MMMGEEKKNPPGTYLRGIYQYQFAATKQLYSPYVYL